MSDQEIKALMREIREKERSETYDDLVEGLSHEDLKDLKSILR